MTVFCCARTRDELDKQYKIWQNVADTMRDGSTWYVRAAEVKPVPFPEQASGYYYVYKCTTMGKTFPVMLTHEPPVNTMYVGNYRYVASINEEYGDVASKTCQALAEECNYRSYADFENDMLPQKGGNWYVDGRVVDDKGLYDIVSACGGTMKVRAVLDNNVVTVAGQTYYLILKED